MEKKVAEFQSILVPVADTDGGEPAIRLACSLVKKGKTKICAVYVITINRALPIDAEIEPEILKGENVLDHMESVGEEVGCEIETDVIQAREVGPAIVDAAIERNADLILMGVAPKTRFGQFTMGTTVPYVMKNTPCRVMLYQYSVLQGEVK